MTSAKVKDIAQTTSAKAKDLAQSTSKKAGDIVQDTLPSAKDTAQSAYMQAQRSVKQGWDKNLCLANDCSWHSNCTPPGKYAQGTREFGEGTEKAAGYK